MAYKKKDRADDCMQALTIIGANRIMEKNGIYARMIATTTIAEIACSWIMATNVSVLKVYLPKWLLTARSGSLNSP